MRSYISYSLLGAAASYLAVMGLLREYFQGCNNMVPTAVSQILEQIARVFYMLAATYAVMKLFNEAAHEKRTKTRCA